MAANDRDNPLSRPRRGSTLIIRWWHEAIDDEPVDHDHSLRGTVLDLGGRTLGHFAGRQAMLELVGAITSRPPPGFPGPPSPDAAEA